MILHHGFTEIGLWITMIAVPRSFREITTKKGTSFAFSGTFPKIHRKSVTGKQREVMPDNRGIPTSHYLADDPF
jgi:hypothetical protein